jgi:transposase
VQWTTSFTEKGGALEIMDYDNDCASIFAEDVTEKKKTGRGAFSKTSCTRKRNGGMPSDFLRGKKLREYMGNSEVITYNLNDIKKVKHNKHGKKTSAEDDVCICEMYVGGKKTPDIIKKYGISFPTLYGILKRNGIPKRTDNLKEPLKDTSPELISGNELEPITLCEPREDFTDYKYEFECLEKKYSLLKHENDKYKIALLNLALRAM